MVTEEDIKRIYGKEFDYEKVIGTEYYLNTLQDNQLVMWGDGKTYYWRLTKKAIPLEAEIIQKIAEAIVEEIFISGTRGKATRLVFEFEDRTNDGSGWGKKPIVDIILKHLKILKI